MKIILHGAAHRAERETPFIAVANGFVHADNRAHDRSTYPRGSAWRRWNAAGASARPTVMIYPMRYAALALLMLAGCGTQTGDSGTTGSGTTGSVPSLAAIHGNPTRSGRAKLLSQLGPALGG